MRNEKSLKILLSDWLHREGSCCDARRQCPTNEGQLNILYNFSVSFIVQHETLDCEKVMVAQEVAKEKEVLAGEGERTEIQLEVKTICILVMATFGSSIDLGNGNSKVEEF